MNDDERKDSPETPDDDSSKGDDTAPESGPEAKPKRFEIEGGEDWKPLSNNPEVEAMGKLSWEDLQEAINDREHPQHEQAIEYARLLGERMRKSYSASLPDFSHLTKQYEKIARDIARSIKLPTFNTPRLDLSSLMATPTLRPPIGSPPSGPGRLADDVDSPSDSSPEASEIPNDPAGQSDTDIGREAVQMVVLLQGILQSLAELNVQQSKQSDEHAVATGLQAQRVRQEEDRVKQESERAEKAERRAVLSFWAAIVAILATAGVGVIQICQYAGLFWNG